MEPLITQDQIDAAIRFHGHWCPGLAIGIRASELALKEIGSSEDEEIVTITETDMCGVDAIQFFTGCTFGKGNLIFKDRGKMAFSFFRRSDGKALRIIARPFNVKDVDKLGPLQQKKNKEGLNETEMAMWEKIRQDMVDHVMQSSLDELFEIKEPIDDLPDMARILSTLICERCNEPVMESRTKKIDGKVICISCLEK